MCIVCLAAQGGLDLPPTTGSGASRAPGSDNVVTDYSALLNGATTARWNARLEEGTAQVVTYRFYDDGTVPGVGEMPRGYGADSTRAMDAAQRANVRLALEEYEKAAGLRFVELGAGDERAMISMHMADGSRFGGWAEYPSVGAVTARGSNLVIDNALDLARGTFGWDTVLHEMGHALGMKHPFEPSTANDATLAPAYENNRYTIMSYDRPEGYAETLKPFDEKAMRALYGGTDGIADWAVEVDARTITIRGTDRAEGMSAAGDADSRLIAGGGDDRLAGGAGSDVLDGGTGSDRIDGGFGDDTIVGGRGDDVIHGEYAGALNYGYASEDTIRGGGGRDTIDGGVGDDRLSGGFGADDLTGGLGADRIAGGKGDDTIMGDVDRESNYRGTDDHLSGGRGDDRVYGGGGDDDVRGNAGDDLLAGDRGNDVLRGNAGRDRLEGGSGSDELRGGKGDDHLIGDAAGEVYFGDDVLLGGKGRDRLEGGEGADTLKGGAGNDVLIGGPAGGPAYSNGDTLIGGGGDDRLIGSGRWDVLEGGKGADTMTGGGGGDRFVFTSADRGSRDTITDFASRSDDLDFGALGLGRGAVRTNDASEGLVVSAGGVEVLLIGVRESGFDVYSDVIV